MTAEIISIGNELLSGFTVNTNASFISARLYQLGLKVQWVQTIGDRAADIRDALQTALARSRVVLLTGGLGPTHDDITKNVVCEFFGGRLVENKEILHEVEARFARRGIPMPPVNRNQALVPDNAELMENPVGTAPGMIFRQKEKWIFVMPGVPREMKAMVENGVLPMLRRECPECQVQVDLFRTTGIPESAIYERIAGELEKFSTYEVAFLPKFTGVDIRVVRRGKDITDAHRFRKFSDLIHRAVGKHIYTTNQIELAEVVGNLLRERELTIAVAESLTGGLLQDKLTDIPGSSDYFMGGLVTYSNRSKQELLGVKAESLQKFGAVSETVAREMAEGVRRTMGTDIGLATTGIAGPGGSSEEKPVGLVYIAVADSGRTDCRKFTFSNDRRINKERSAQTALELVRRLILEMPI